MRICIIAEGSYPYVVGGVSNWVHNLICHFPEHEFVLFSIVANRSFSAQFKYELPSNLLEAYEVYLNDSEWSTKGKKNRRLRLTNDESAAIRSLLFGTDIMWRELFDIFQKPSFSINDLLMGEDFLEITKDFYNAEGQNLVFSDFLWTIRSIYLPLCQTMKCELPKADLYHCVATGYAGVVGSMAKEIHGGKLLVSEHGIYTREREEELIKATWVESVFKDIWIQQFRKMSKLAYQYADIVTALYPYAAELQVDLGCPEEKVIVTPNGVNADRLLNLPGKTSGDEFESYINIGAIVRLVPVKDIKTLISAFKFAKEQEPRLKLWIMGPIDEDPEYAQECFDMVMDLQLEEVVFTGMIDIRDYLGKMDYTILTSISEGQPLAVLESFAVRKPVIATNVGNCSGLIVGDNDDYGSAGIVLPAMAVSKIANAMVELAKNRALREKMGEIGYRRATVLYNLENTMQKYTEIYDSLLGRDAKKTDGKDEELNSATK